MHLALQKAKVLPFFMVHGNMNAMRNLPYTLAAVCVLLAACSQPQPAMTNNRPRTQSFGQQKDQTVQRQYLALPGQSAIRVGTEDADAAFDRQVNAYAGETAPVSPQLPADPVASPINAFPTPQGQNSALPGRASVPAEIPDPRPVLAVTDPVQSPGATIPAPAAPAAPVANAVPGTADYAVQITNGTTGRIFVEAQDAAGHIFPCGSMFGGQSINTPPDPIGPLKGPITVVVRDPDKEGAPEIRRYQVQPPADYKGKTVGITILPGGQYRADVDKEVYYISPAPERPAAQPEPTTAQ